MRGLAFFCVPELALERSERWSRCWFSFAAFASIAVNGFLLWLSYAAVAMGWLRLRMPPNLFRLGLGSRLGNDRLGLAQIMFAFHSRLDALNRARPLVELAENHLPGRGLEHRGDSDIHILADELARIVHHDHGSVIQVGDTLVVFLAFLEDEDPHGLARQHDRLKRIGQFIDIQHFHALKLGDLVEIEIIGDDFCLVQFRQFNQLQVDFADGRKIILYDLDIDGADLLHSLQNVEAAPAAIALQRIGGVGNQLQFAQDKLRNYQDAVQEAGLSDVGDAAVNNHAGVKYLESPAALLLCPKNSAQGSQIQQIAFVGANDQAHIVHEQHDHELQKPLGWFMRDAAVNDQAEKISPQDAKDAAYGGANQALEADDAQPHFKRHHCGANHDSRSDCFDPG